MLASLAPKFLSLMLSFMPLSMNAMNPHHPLIIGHRGAPGFLPEHTLAGYELAIDQGADFIEPDLVSTKDGYLIARHENEIGGTTDVADKFPERKRTQMIDGQEVTGWFTEDFTLAEIRTLRARERLPFRSQAHNDQFSIPTFESILQLVERKERETGRRIGVYIETKHPTHFRKINLPIEPRLLETLDRFGLNRADAPVYIQSFEVSNLQWLNRRTEIPLVQLIEEGGQPADQSGTGITYSSMITPAGLRTVRGYADGIGPSKRLIVPEKAGHLQAPTALIKQAHALGLVVHPWTFRSDPQFLHPDYHGNAAAEYHQFFNLGVDAVFSDFTAHAVAARANWIEPSWQTP